MPADAEDTSTLGASIARGLNPEQPNNGDEKDGQESR
jgi:hypothetical protein